MKRTFITGADVKNTLKGEFPLDEFEIVQFEVIWKHVRRNILSERR